MSQGFTNRMGIKKQGAFITAVAVTDIIPFLNESLTRNRPAIARNYLSGISGKRQPDFPIEHVAGDVAGEMVIDEIATDPIGWEHFLQGALGTSAWDAVNSLNLYTVADNLPSYTIAALKRTGVVWENIGCMINTLEISGSMSNQTCQFSAGLIGYKQLQTADAGITNTSATFTGLTPANEPSKLLFQDLVIRVADVANALAVGDKINVSEFNLSINNNLEDPVFATPDNTTHTSSEFPMEYLRNGLREVNLSLTLPRYSSETYFQALLAATTLQADLIWTVGSYNFKIFLPLLKVIEPSAPTSGAEIIPQTVNLEAHWNAGATGLNTYMVNTAGANITGEIAMEAKSKRTAAPA